VAIALHRIGKNLKDYPELSKVYQKLEKLIVKKQ
jgi:hypothetical protein